eukprot:PhM_4_TR19130/c0_g2_i1/m.40709
MTIEGAVALQLSPKSVGIFEAFYNTIKPLQMCHANVTILEPGKLQGGETRIPFEFTLDSIKNPNATFVETYHGVFINASYTINVHVTRGMFGKSLKESEELLVIVPGQAVPSDPLVLKQSSAVPYALRPDAVKNVRKQTITNVPQFIVDGQIDSTVCDISKPITGSVVISECEAAIKSVEIQLVRVEFCAAPEGVAKEATEIQNIQIGDGDVVRGMEIPIFMIFPRWFTCPTLVAANFKVEFEVNLVILLQDNHQITENFPIRLYRTTDNKDTEVML